MWYVGDPPLVYSSPLLATFQSQINAAHGVTLQDRQCTYNVTFRRVRVSVRGYAVSSNIFYVCVCVAVVMQHERRMRRVKVGTHL